MRRYPTLREFLQANNPDCQLKVCDNVDECFFGDSPSLALLNTTYGTTAAAAWLVPEITEASVFCGLKENPNQAQLDKLARIIVTNYWYLTVDELLLFFFHFCSARYRHFYSYFAPSVIIHSLQDFLLERSRAYNDREQKMQELKREQSRKEAITYEEYIRMKESGEL